MKRKLLSLLLAFSMLASLLCVPAQAETAFQFSDDGVSSTWNWASKYIYTAYERGVFKGDTAGNFNADASLTRAEAVTALLALKGVTVDTSVKVSGFDDADGHWYTPYVAAAKKEGMSAGYDEDGKTLFKPDDGITRAEFVTMLLSAMGITVDKTVKESGFADSDGHWYTPYVAAARETGLSAGYNENGQTIFKPDKVIIRAEAATMVASVRIDPPDAEPTETTPAETTPAETTPAETEPVETDDDINEPPETVSVKVGDYITYGTYEQDNDTTNGAEPIEWQVLDVQGSKALVISRYVLDARAYNETGEDTTWGDSTLRSWLNSDFYYNAFDELEMHGIYYTNVQNPDSYYGTDENDSWISNNTGDKIADLSYQVPGGDETGDKLFLLSLDEVQNYFDCTCETETTVDGQAYEVYPDLLCAPTAYAAVNGVTQSDTQKTVDGDSVCWWWVRSPGIYAYTAAFVGFNGWFTSYGGGCVVSSSDVGVRPAMWVDIHPVATSGTCGENCFWSYDDGVLTISGTGDMYDYKCEEYEDDCLRTTAPWKFFSSEIWKIVVEDGVTSVGNFAAYNIADLTEVDLPETVTSIGKDAFANTPISEIDLPEHLTSIGDGAFINTLLNEITIPESAVSIGEGALELCRNLTSVTLPTGLTSISSMLLDGCSSLTEITIPSGVTSINNFAFSGCTSLTAIVIPENVTSIGDYVFNDCENLTSVTLPDGLTTIGPNAFRDCSRLTDIVIPESVTKIGSFAFICCTSLTDITIPEGVEAIGDDVFNSCTKLTTVTIPKSVVSIEYMAFWYCLSLTDVYYAGTRAEWDAIEIDNGDDRNSCLLNAKIHCTDDPDDSSVFADVKVGDYVTFGSYEQDNDTTNGKEEIEWRVLAVEDGKALLISKYALDWKHYNETAEEVTWETCTLRSWLNSDFYDNAFSSTEKNLIELSYIENPGTYVGYTADNEYAQQNTGDGITNLGYQVDGGNDTYDRVFLLNLDETVTYFDSASQTLTDLNGNSYTAYPDMACTPTAYAVAQGVDVSDVYTTPDGDDCCIWWLRCPGQTAKLASAICFTVGKNQYWVAYNMIGVRPAIWVDIT